MCCYRLEECIHLFEIEKYQSMTLYFILIDLSDWYFSTFDWMIHFFDFFFCSVESMFLFFFLDNQVVEHGLGHFPFTEKQVVTPTGVFIMCIPTSSLLFLTNTFYPCLHFGCVCKWGRSTMTSHNLSSRWVGIE